MPSDADCAPVHRDPRRRIDGRRDPPRASCARASPPAASPHEPHARRRPPSWRNSTASPASRSKSSPTATPRRRHPADIVLIGVKPAMVPDLLREIAPHLAPGAIVVSLAAGVTIATFESHPRRRRRRAALDAEHAGARRQGGDGTRRRDPRATADDVARRPRAVRDGRHRHRGAGVADRRALDDLGLGPGVRLPARSRSSPKAAIGKGFAEAEARADGRADLHRRRGAARGIRRGPRRAAPPRHEPEGHDRARDRRAAGRAPRRACSPRRRMPRSPAPGSCARRLT